METASDLAADAASPLYECLHSIAAGRTTPAHAARELAARELAAAELASAEATAPAENAHPAVEPLAGLLQRLGPPPPELRVAWQQQLHRLADHYAAARLPIGTVSLQQIGLDATHRLTLLEMPRSIAQRLVEELPQPRDAADWEAGWDRPEIARRANEDAAALHRLADDLENQIDQLLGRPADREGAQEKTSRCSPTTARPTREETRPTVSVAATPRPRKRRADSPASPMGRRLWTVAVAIAVPALAGIGWSVSRWRGGDMPRAASTRFEPVAATAAAADGSDPPQATELERLLPAPELLEPSAPEIGEVANGLWETPSEPLLDIDLAGLDSPEGSTGQQNRETEIEIESREETVDWPMATRLDPSAAETSVTLPPRSDHQPLVLGPLTAATPSLELQMLGDSSAWRLVEEASGWRVRYGAEASAENAVDVARLRRDEGELTFQWLEAAEELAAADSLRNGRLVTGGGQPGVGARWWLRPALEIDPWRIELRSTDLRSVWELGSPVDPRATRLTLRAEPPDALRILWEEPPEDLPARRGTLRAEALAGDDDSVAVLLRWDYVTTSRLVLRLRVSGRLDAAAAWHPVSAERIDRWLDRALRDQEALEQSLLAIQARTSQTRRRALRSMLSRERQAVEASLRRSRELIDRLGRLQRLVAQLENDVRWHPELRVRWPEEDRVLLSAP